MRIGVTVPNIHETLAERSTIEAAGRMAEELGFDSVWCNDHLALPSASPNGGAQPAYAAAYGEQRGQNIYEPLIVLAYLAAMTRRVLLGTSVYLLALRSPLLAARQAVSLDRLSGGRLVLGVGVGWLQSEFAAMGVPYRQRGRRTDEAIALLKALCGSDSADFLPKPVQRRRDRGDGGRARAGGRLAPDRRDPRLERSRAAGEPRLVRARGAPGVAACVSSTSRTWAWECTRKSCTRWRRSSATTPTRDCPCRSATACAGTTSGSVRRPRWASAGRC